jgi:hypothetical protein
VADPEWSPVALGHTGQLWYRLYILHVAPTAVLFASIAAVVWSGAPSTRPRLDEVIKTVRALNIRDAWLLLIGAIVLSLILQPLQFALIRFMEGYWGNNGVGRALSHLGIAWQRWRHRRFEQARIIRGERTGWRLALAEERSRSASKRLEQYPAASRLLPTRLGNAMRAAEDRAGSRHGLRAVAVWPRLYPLVSDRLASILVEQRHDLDVTTRFCATFLVDGVAVALLLYRHGLWLWVPVGLLALGWISYRSAVSAALAYGTTVEAAFDLHRFDLIRAMHLELPTDRDQEHRLNSALSQFLQFGGEHNFLYATTSKSLRRELPKAVVSARGHRSDDRHAAIIAAGDETPRMTAHQLIVVAGRSRRGLPSPASASRPRTSSSSRSAGICASPLRSSRSVHASTELLPPDAGRARMGAESKEKEAASPQLRADGAGRNRITTDSPRTSRKPLKSRGFHGFESHPCRHRPAERRASRPWDRLMKRAGFGGVLTARRGSGVARAHDCLARQARAARWHRRQRCRLPAVTRARPAVREHAGARARGDTRRLAAVRRDGRSA